jgi:cytochrome b
MKDDLERAGRPVRIWDLPTRLFHWALVGLIVLLFGTGEFGLLDMHWHFWAGYAALALIVFRILWGFLGSQTSRFAEFLRGPSVIAAYLEALFSTNPKISIGHNPLGGWSVLALLLSVLLQAVTGLFSSDEIDTDGPLVQLVATRTVKLMTRLHHWNENVLLALICLHIVAVLLYLLLRHENLIGTMISGRRHLPDAGPLRFANGWLAAVLLLLSAAAVAALVWWAGT